MKLFVALSLLFLLAVVSCKKVDQHSKEKSHVWSQKKSHSGKKYDQEKFNHHDKHQKIHHKYSIKHEQHSVEGKDMAHHGYHEVPKHEAELQKDIKATKKEIEDRLAKEEQHLSLQHLTYPRNPDNISHKNRKNSHWQQSSKASHHFSDSDGQKVHHHKAQDEKLFVFPESKETKSMQSHSVLEDSFEAFGKEVQEQPEHPHLKKESTKNKKPQKKAYEKMKEKTKKKEYEKTKTKDDKKDKKQQYKGKKEK